MHHANYLTQEITISSNLTYLSIFKDSIISIIVICELAMLCCVLKYNNFRYSLCDKLLYCLREYCDQE